jgi:hypothetical protein
VVGFVEPVVGFVEPVVGFVELRVGLIDASAQGHAELVDARTQGRAQVFHRDPDVLQNLGLLVVS